MDEHRELVVQPGVTDAEAKAPAAPPNVELTVEEVIDVHVGSLGFAQLLHVFLVSIAWVFDAQSTLVTIYSDAQPAWRCKGSGSAACLAAMSSPAGMCGLQRGAWEWVAGNKSSIIAEWGLICDKRFAAGIPASLFFIGSLLGSAVQGRLADTYLGRKKTVLFSCLLVSLTTFLTSLAPSLWVYTLLRFSSGFARSGIGICCLVLATEAVGRKWRGQVGQYGFFFFTVGFLSVPAVAYPARHSWRNIYKVMSLPPLVYSLLILPFISESPRWLAIRGRSQEAIQVLAKFAKLNGRRLPANLSISNPVSANSSGKAESLWSAKWATRRIATLMAAGFGVGFVYYGVQLNVENLNFNLYFTVGVNALMEIPAVFFGSVLLSFMGRKVLFSSSAFLAGVSCMLCILFAKKSHSPKSRGSFPQLSIEAVGFMAASMAFNILYVYCVELFPTNVRNFALSMMRQTLMLGAAIAPHLVVLGRLSPSISFLIFGGLSIASGLVTFWLPETRNAPLCETLEQQEQHERLHSVTANSRGGAGGVAGP